MNAETAENAGFIAQSLLDQARQVRNFAKTYPAAFANRRDADGRKHYTKFLASAERLLLEVEALCLMARHPEIRRRCNTEQMEAYLEEADIILSGLKAVSPLAVAV